MASSDEYHTIHSAVDVENFVSQVPTFHDGVLREMAFLNSTFVQPNLSMTGFGLPTLRILIQTQWAESSAVELVLEGVLLINLEFFILTEGDNIIYDSKLTWAEGHLELELDGNRIHALSARWIKRLDWMGDEARFTSWATQ